MNICFVSHGGGPLPLLGDAAHQEMRDTLAELTRTIMEQSENGKPSAVVVFSAHWESVKPRVTAAANPSLLYDYYGFPPAAYELSYPVYGAPELAKALVEVLHPWEAVLDDERGLDHGAFVPLSLMFPEADIPVVQVSLNSSLDASLHIEMGRALQQLPDRFKHQLLVLGSGFSFHNLREFFAPSSPEKLNKNENFHNWLTTTLSDTNLSESERAQGLIDWEQAPYARYCHPREEHLLPLHVCYGAASRATDMVRTPTILHQQAGMFLWLDS